ncbi:MAG: hypothetical protein LBQ33_06980 [Oscillospiraceae bacterium]|jgi:predicted small lipoprotein YifL|nr:hypothetical protein [Oscillospiraceae bacterium]
MKKRFLRQGLALLFLLSALAGCGTASPLPSTAETATQTGQSTAQRPLAQDSAPVTALEVTVTQWRTHGKTTAPSGTAGTTGAVRTENAAEQTSAARETQTATTIRVQTTARRESTGVLVPLRTEEELRDFFAAHPVLYGVGYSAVPRLGYPYSAGALNGETAQSARNHLNRLRFTAGVPAEVALNDEMNRQAQAAAALLAKNGVLSHNPTKPWDVPQEAFDLGFAGASASNLASTDAQDTLNSALRLFLGDSDSANIGSVAHRRWMLSPLLGQTGFGAVNGFAAMYVKDKSNAQAASVHAVVPFPAQLMPLQYFSADWAWSVAMDEGFDISGAAVTLLRRADGRTWRFGAEEDGVFYRSVKSSGQRNCVIFRPDGITLAPGETYDVRVDGVTKNGEAYLIAYTVVFAEV